MAHLFGEFARHDKEGVPQGVVVFLLAVYARGRQQAKGRQRLQQHWLLNAKP